MSFGLPRFESPLAREVANAMATIPIDFGGGASSFKGALMAKLVVERQLHTLVEIGVHRGRSLVALGTAARQVPGAHVWGIDPYSLTAYPDPDMGGAGPDGVADWLLAHDFEGACRDAVGAIDRLQLKPWCTLLRETSTAAARQFDLRSIDLLHVDGNHSEDAVRDDLTAYLPRVRAGGIVVLDDVSWTSVEAAAQTKLQGATTLFELIDLNNLAGSDYGNDFRIYRLPP